MVYILIVLLVVIAGMGVAIHFQLKASHRQAEEQQQLLADYQRRVDEQQKLLDDYRALEKNFDNIGEGYEQALLAFDKMEEDKQQAKSVNDALQQRCDALQQELTALRDADGHRREALLPLRRQLQELGRDDVRLARLAGVLGDVDDVLPGQAPLERTDNVLVGRVADEAVRLSGIDKASYLRFDCQTAADAAATMLYTNLETAARALTHLLDNALKFTTEGTVTLRVGVDMDRMLAVYAVEDTGSGIAVEDAARVFEPYVKLNQYFDGQGIGLTVARNIAQRLGGDVVLDAAYAGPGSRFVLTLPI